MTSSRFALASHPWTAVVILYVGLACAYCWPMFLSFDTALPSDTGDPGLIAWGLWWNAVAVPLTERWWNAPMFFPIEGVLAFSETFLGLAPFTTPLHWLGVGTVATYNLVFLLSIPTAATAAHALAKHLTGRHDVALIAGLAFAFSPYRASQMPHLHLLITCWMPLALLALHRFLESHRRRHLLLFTIAWMLNGLTTGYYLVFFAVLVGLWMLWFVRAPRQWVAIGLAAGIATLPVLPVLYGYQRVQNTFGLSRDIGEIQAFSADLSALGAVSPHNWLPFHWGIQPRPEGELYPGLAILVLVLGGVVIAWRRSTDGSRRAARARKYVFAAGLVMLGIAALVSFTGGLETSIAGVDVTMTRPHKSFTIACWLLFTALLLDPRVPAMWRRRTPFAFYATAAGVMLLLALGPVARAFDYRFLAIAPYAWLMELPGGQSLRVPARFAMLMMLCLAQAATLSLARFVPQDWRRPAVALVAVLVLAEGWVPMMPMAPVGQMVALGGIPPGTPVLEIPMRDLYTDTAAMLRSTEHGHPLINGFSGYSPVHYPVLQEALRAGDASVFPALQQLGRLAVLVDRANDADGTQTILVEQVPGAVQVYRTPVGPVYILPAIVPRPVVTLEPVPIEAVVDRQQENVLRIMSDDDLDSQWVSRGPQEAGDALTLDFDEPVVVSRLVIELGRNVLNYPRLLQVSLQRSDGTSDVVWEGGTAGLAVSGAIADRARIPLTIDLSHEIPAETITLTLLAGHETFYWSIAEIRAFARVF